MFKIKSILDFLCWVFRCWLSPEKAVTYTTMCSINRKKRWEPENEEYGLQVEPVILSVEVLFLGLWLVLSCLLFSRCICLKQNIFIFKVTWISLALEFAFNKVMYWFLSSSLPMIVLVWYLIQWQNWAAIVLLSSFFPLFFFLQLLLLLLNFSCLSVSSPWCISFPFNINFHKETPHFSELQYNLEIF